MRQSSFNTYALPILLGIFLLFALSDCQRLTHQDSQDSGGNNEREKRWKNYEVQADELLIEQSKLHDQYLSFQSEAEKLFTEVHLLTHHPGWPSLYKITKNNSSIEYIEGSAIANEKTTQALNLWSSQWNADGENFYKKYLKLVDRSQQMEQKRITYWNQHNQLTKKRHDNTLSHLLSIMDPDQPGTPYFNAAVMESFPEKHRKELERNRKLRNIYGLGSDGLFRRKLSREEVQSLLSN